MELLIPIALIGESLTEVCRLERSTKEQKKMGRAGVTLNNFQ